MATPNSSNQPDILNTPKDAVIQVSPIVEDERTKNLSLIEYLGHDAHSCGYCKNGDNKGRWSYGKYLTRDLDAKRLKADDYQGLLDRGWRRSGTYCYCPMNEESCCLNFAIICDAVNFQFTRSKRKCIERMNSFLVTGDIKASIDYHIRPDGQCMQSNLDDKVEKLARSYELIKTSNKSKDKRFKASCDRKMKLYGISEKEALRRILDKKERRLAQQKAQRRALEDYLYPETDRGNSNQNPSSQKHKLVIKMLHVDSEEIEKLKAEEHSLIQKYQAAVHHEDGSTWTYSKFADFLVESPLITEEFYTSSEASDTLATNVHGSRSFRFVEPPELPTAFGTYHCVYFLDGKLIAVGVLDVLPRCLTTVYFFYDPAYSFLNLGIYSALVEISMVRQIQQSIQIDRITRKLTYYNLGFYVHKCDKMRYKSKFKPSYLMCSETYEFVPTETCLRLLEGKSYVRFSESGQRANWSNDQILQVCLSIPFLTPVTKGSNMRDYIEWLQNNLGDRFVFYLVSSILPDYIIKVGPELSRRMAFYCRRFHRILVREFLMVTNQIQ